MDNALVAVKSAWASKINWLQALGAAGTLITTLAAGLPPDQAAKWTATVAIVTNIATVIIKTWFTTTVTPASAKKV